MCCLNRLLTKSFSRGLVSVGIGEKERVAQSLACESDGLDDLGEERVGDVGHDEPD